MYLSPRLAAQAASISTGYVLTFVGVMLIYGFEWALLAMGILLIVETQLDRVLQAIDNKEE